MPPISDSLSFCKLDIYSHLHLSNSLLHPFQTAHFSKSHSRNFGAGSARGLVKFGSNFRCNSSFRNIHMENNHHSNSRGALIVLEGLDRSGKSSQSSRMISYLEGLGVSAELWRFPDRSTCVGQMISSYLANQSELDDHTIHLLFSANRWEKRCLFGLCRKSSEILLRFPL